MTFALLLSMLAAIRGPEPGSIVVTGHPWAPFISPMGEPFRARTKGDDTLALWFRQADRNQDGLLTAAEMQADADRFFAKLDTNHDSTIEPEELIAYEWEVAPEIQVNSRWRRAPGEPAADRGQASEQRRPEARRRLSDEDLIAMYGPQGAARYALLNIPEPVAGADSDLDRLVTLAEFRKAAIERFQLLDRQRRGQVTLAELEGLVPPPPKPGKRIRIDKDAADTRIGVPLPREIDAD